jgi:signal peptidase
MKTVRIIYRIFSVILITAIILITLLALLLGISGMDKENPKNVLGFRAFVVLSDSMSPVFNEGSVIITREVPAKELKAKNDAAGVEGDIITYIREDSLLTHRIVEVRDDGTFITRGETNNYDDDPPVQPEWILGKTVFSMDGLGTFIDNLRTPWGIAGMIAVLAAGLFIIPYFLEPKNADDKKTAAAAAVPDDGELNGDKNVNEDVSEVVNGAAPIEESIEDIIKQYQPSDQNNDGERSETEETDETE